MSLALSYQREFEFTYTAAFAFCILLQSMLITKHPATEESSAGAGTGRDCLKQYMVTGMTTPAAARETYRLLDWRQRL